MIGFVFNTRLPKFADPRVRQALGMLFDFEWANKNLFGGKYKRTVSFWQGSELSALGVPASDKEKALLAAFPGAVRPDVMDGTWRPPVTDGSGQDRKVLKRGVRPAEGGRLHDAGRQAARPDGKPFASRS